MDIQIQAKKIYVSVIKGSRLLYICMLFLFVAGCATTSTESDTTAKADRISIEEQWGVRIESLRTASAGNLIDFRYRIIDPDKALPLVDRRNKAYLIDEASGASLEVPNTAKIGPLRQTVRYGKPKEDRIYFVLFGNPGEFIKPGNRVTVVIGDFRVENLIVE
jgi:hypothetical protein